MKTVNDYITRNDPDVEIIIEANVDGCQVERYYIGRLGNIPEELRSQVVLDHAWYVDADMPVLTIARNSTFCKFMYMDTEFDDGTDQQLGKYDVEVANGRGYYDENGNFCRFADEAYIF